MLLKVSSRLPLRPRLTTDNALLSLGSPRHHLHLSFRPSSLRGRSLRSTVLQSLLLLPPFCLPHKAVPMFSESRQAWRSHPAMRMSTNVPRMLPGLGWATGIFGVYVFAEAFYNRLPAKKDVEVHVPELTAATDSATGSATGNSA